MASKISEIKKRDGSVAAFDSSKIANAIFKAARSVGGQNKEEADRLADKVVKELEEQAEGIPTVEQLQDLVEKVLIEAGHAKTAKAYIVYRQKRAEAREEKMRVLEKDYLDEVDKRFDVNALRVLKARYLKKDEKTGKVPKPENLGKLEERISRRGLDFVIERFRLSIGRGNQLAILDAWQVPLIKDAFNFYDARKGFYLPCNSEKAVAFLDSFDFFGKS